MCQAASQSLPGQACSLNAAEEKMGGLEGSSPWAVRVGPFTSNSAWGNSRDRTLKGLLWGRGLGGNSPFDPSLLYPFIVGTAMPSPLWFVKWGRENIASSYRFPPACPVALDEVLEGSGAEKPPQSWASLGNVHFCKGCRTSANLHIFQKDKPHPPLQLNILLPSDRSSWHWKAALGGFWTHPARSPHLSGLQTPFKGLKISSIASMITALMRLGASCFF